MKILVPVGLIVLSVSMHGFSQKVAKDWSVELLPTAREKTSESFQTEPVRYQIKTSATRREKQSEEIRGLGDVPTKRETILTLQLVAPPDLPVSPSSPPIDEQNTAEHAETDGGETQSEGYSSKLVMISATVYDGRATLLRIDPPEENSEALEAWSNIDFNHFTGEHAGYRVHHPNGGGNDIYLVMGLGNENRNRRIFREEEWPVIPDLPDLKSSGPSFDVIRGSSTGTAREILEQLHALYAKEGESLKLQHELALQELKKIEEARKADANKPRQVTIRVWKRTADEIQNSQAITK